MEYDDMLDRAMEETPEIDGTSERFEVPDPDVRQEGNVTVYENFQSTCSRLGREDDHVMKFLQNDLGTSGHIDESGRARLTGEFDADRIERPSTSTSTSSCSARSVGCRTRNWNGNRARCCSAVRRVAPARRRASSYCRPFSVCKSFSVRVKTASRWLA